MGAKESLKTGARYAAALFVSLLLFPLLLPVLLHLPQGAITRKWYRIALNCLSVIAYIAAVDGSFLSPEEDLEKESTLHVPILKVWTSDVIVKGGKKIVCRTYDQPGRWMANQGLRELQLWLASIARESMGTVPTHALFDQETVREVMSNRVVTIAFDDGKPVAFTAMVYIPFQGSCILHLGLTCIGVSHRGIRLQSPIFTKCLVMPMINMRKQSYYITNIGASPAGIGAVSDYFVDTYPHYNGSHLCTQAHLDIARHVLKHYRNEFACSTRARFDEKTFVVHGSNMPEGGGAPEFIKEDGNAVSAYKNQICNDFCKKRLDLAAGDEQFQVARVDFVTTSIKYLVAPKKRSK